MNVIQTTIAAAKNTVKTSNADNHVNSVVLVPTVFVYRIIVPFVNVQRYTFYIKMLSNQLTLIIFFCYRTISVIRM